MSNELQQMFKEMFSYLCLYVEDDLVQVYINLKQVNQAYVETFDKIKLTNDPTKIAVTIMDAQNPKAGIASAFEMNKEGVDNIKLVAYTTDEIIEVHPEIFEDKD